MKDYIHHTSASLATGMPLSQLTRSMVRQEVVGSPPDRADKRHRAGVLGRTGVLGLMGLGCLALGAFVIVWAGEIQRITSYISAGVCNQMWVFQDIHYPSSPELLGIWMAGPAGLISLLSLAGAMLLGVMGLRNAKLNGASWPGRLLTMLLSLIVPLLAIDFAIASVIEFSSRPRMAAYLDHDPVALSLWSAAAISLVVVASLSIDLLALVWTWRVSRRDEINPQAL